MSYDRRVLISGFRGQDGSLLVKALADCCRVVLIEGHDRILASPLAVPHDKVVVNLCDVQELVAVIKSYGITDIFWLAGPSKVYESWSDPLSCISFHINSTIALLEACKSVVKPPKVFLSGSSEIFDPAVDYYDETSAEAPQTPYAVAKLSVRKLAELYRDKYRLKIVYAILGNHESVHRPAKFLVGKVFAYVSAYQSGLRRPLELGNLGTVRDFGYAPEFAEIFVELMSADFSGDVVISSGEAISVQELIEAIFLWFNIPLDRISANDQQFSRTEAERRVGNTDKLERIIGRVPRLAGTKLAHQLCRDFEVSKQ